MSKPRLFHLFKSCPDHSWVDGNQVMRLTWSEDGNRVTAGTDDDDLTFEDQEVDLVDGFGEAKDIDGLLATVDFEIPWPIRITSDNWEEHIPLKGAQ